MYAYNRDTFFTNATSIRATSIHTWCHLFANDLSERRTRYYNSWWRHHQHSQIYLPRHAAFRTQTRHPRPCSRVGTWRNARLINQVSFEFHIGRIYLAALRERPMLMASSALVVVPCHTTSHPWLKSSSHRAKFAAAIRMSWESTFSPHQLNLLNDFLVILYYLCIQLYGGVSTAKLTKSLITCAIILNIADWRRHCRERLLST
jgi:hypothetical protein